MQVMTNVTNTLLAGPYAYCENSALQHPYRDIYYGLKLLGSSSNGCRGELLRNLSKEAGLAKTDQVKLELLRSLPWFEPTLVEEIFYLSLRERFAYGMLDADTLKTIRQYSPIVYMGAGNGYNAWLLEQLGADILSLDAFPVEEGSNWFFNTRYGFPSGDGKSWTKVQKGDSTSLRGIQNRTLFLCWPPKNSMAAKCLSAYSGNTLVLVGTKKSCANTAFFRELERNWEPLYSIKTGVWKSLHTEWLEVYERRQFAAS